MFTTAQVSEQTAIPRRTLNQWVHFGILQPEGAKAGRGRYHAATWEERHIKEALLIKRLRDMGLSMQRLHRVGDYLRGLGYNPFSTGKFIVIGTDLLRVVNEDDGVSLLRSRGQLILPLVEERE